MFLIISKLIQFKTITSAKFVLFSVNCVLLSEVTVKVMYFRNVAPSKSVSEKKNII